MSNSDIFNSLAAIDAYKKRLGLWQEEEILIRDLFSAKGGKVLILGCGAGRTVIPLVKMGYRVTAFDIASNMIAETRAKLLKYGLSAETVIGDAADLSQFYDREFDYVFFPYNSIDFLYPLELRKKCFEEVERVLKPRGVFLYTSHNRFYYRNLIKYYLNSSIKPFVKDRQSYGELIGYYASPFEEKKYLMKIYKKAFVCCTRFLKSRFYKNFSPVVNMINCVLVTVSRYPIFYAFKDDG